MRFFEKRKGIFMVFLILIDIYSQLTQRFPQYPVAFLRPIYLILLMLLQQAILEKISTKNLVTVTVSETHLQNNFELILKALKSHDSCISNLISKVNSLENSAKQHQETNSNGQKTKGKEQKGDGFKHELTIRKLVNRGEIHDQQIKGSLTNFSDVWERMKKLENVSKQMNDKLNEHQSSIEKQEQTQQNFDRRVNKAQERLDIIEQQLSNFDQYGDRLSQLQKQFKDQINKIIKIDQTIKKLDYIDKDSNSKGKDQKQGQNIDKEALNKLLKQLENKLAQILSQHKIQTKSQFQRIYGLINKINQNLQEEANKSKKLSEDIWKLNEQIYKQQSVDLIDPKRISELERKVEQLRIALNNLNNDHNHFSKNYSTAIKTPQKTQQPQWSPSAHRNNQTERQQPNGLNQINEQSQIEDQTSFKKEIIDKLKQQKGDLSKALKKLENINLKKQQDKQRVQQKILRIEHILKGKIDEQGMKKWMRYIENKINYLYRMVNLQSPEQDACIARKNWICLSCDKKLDAYKGKIGNHLISTQLKGKTLEHDVVGGGMLFRSKSRYEMPSVKK